MSEGAAAVRAVRALARPRRGRMSWSDRYVAGFGLVMIIAVLAEPLSSALAAFGDPRDPSRAAAGIALVLLAYAGLLALARAAGPVALPAPDASWLLLSPLDRRALLGRTTRILALVCVPVGITLGVVALAVLGAPDQTVVRLAVAVALGLAASAAGMAAAVTAQASQTWDSWLQAAVAVTVVAAAAVALLGGAGRWLLAASSAPPAYGAALAAVSAAVAALLVRRARAATAAMPARAVLGASTRTGHVTRAATGLDPSVLAEIAEEAHWRGRRLRSRPWPSLPAPLATAWHDWRRLARRPGRLAVLFGVAVLPALVARASGGLTPLTAAAVLAGGLAAAASGVSGARRDGDDPALARLLGAGFRSVLAARALLPALLGAAWLAVALGGLTLAGALPAGPWLLLGVAAAPALAAAALRMARRRPVDHSMPVIDTGGGAVPTGPVMWGLTGADLAVAGCLPLALALTGGSAGPGAFLVAQALTGAAALAAYLLCARRGG
ncbi:DUF6297 family protein [Streptosporangium sandarakinum]|uniref:DUF6297 family protein n=1 Tax=Streptosporangium sandarakinum TaxID=1260955 RepID=UPI00371A4D03